MKAIASYMRALTERGKKADANEFFTSSEFFSLLLINNIATEIARNVFTLQRTFN